MVTLVSSRHGLTAIHTNYSKGPMGVGAIFISTLALTRLPEPSNPPVGQTEILAASLHPIVSFVVLCSILIRKSPIVKNRS